MPEKTNPLTEANREARELIQRAEKFSMKLPVVGTVRVPPPDQLALYGALGLLAALNVIDWPVALAVGAGSAVVARHLNDRAAAPQKKAAAPAKAPAQSAAKAPVKSAAKKSARSARS